MKPKIKRYQLLVPCLFFLIHSILLGQSTSKQDYWPQFRGPNCSGHAAAEAAPPTTLDASTLLWQTRLPKGHSSPCIWGDNIFVTAHIEEKSELQTICIDRDSGKIKWTKSIFPEKIENYYYPLGNAAQTSPATDGERVYVYFGSFGVLCYNNEGELIWEHKIEISPYSYMGVTSSPIIIDSKLIVNHDFKGKCQLLAFDKFTGDTIWGTNMTGATSAKHGNSHTTPIIYQDQIVLHRRREISAYSVEDGRRLWWFPYKSKGISTPVINENVIYVGTYTDSGEPELRGNLPKYFDFSVLCDHFDSNHDGLIQKDELPDTLYVVDRPEFVNFDEAPMIRRTAKSGYRTIDKDKNGSVDKMEWDRTIKWFTGKYYHDAGLIAINPATTGELTMENIVWRELEKVPECPSPIYCKNNIYMCKNGGILTCLDANSGNIHYRERIKGAAGPYFASPVVSNGNIYFASANGKITVIRASNELEIVAQNDLDEKIYATPAIIGDKIYVRTSEHLYAYGKEITIEK